MIYLSGSLVVFHYRQTCRHHGRTVLSPNTLGSRSFNLCCAIRIYELLHSFEISGMLMVVESRNLGDRYVYSQKIIARTLYNVEAVWQVSGEA